MEPNQYGEIIFYVGIAGFASYFALIGTQQTITIYVAKKMPIQAVFFSLSLIIGAVGSVIVFIIYQRIDASILVLAYVISTLAMGELLGKKNYSQFSIIVFIQKIAAVVIGLTFFFMFGSDGIIYALILSYSIFIIQIISGFRESKIDFSVLKNRWRFVINNYVMNISSGLNGQIDKLIIPPILGFAILGNYGLALQALNVLNIIPNIFFRYLLPQDASGIKNKKIKIFSFMISIGIAFFGVAVLPIIIDSFFPKYGEAVIAIQIMSLSTIPYAVNLQYTSEFLAREQSKYVLISYLLLIISLSIGMIVLGPMLGIKGVAISQLCSNIIGTLFLIIMKIYENKKRSN